MKKYRKKERERERGKKEREGKRVRGRGRGRNREIVTTTTRILAQCRVSSTPNGKPRLTKAGKQLEVNE